VKVYAPATCDQPPASSGKVVEETPDSASVDAAATVKPPAAPVRKKTVPPPLSYAFVSAMAGRLANSRARWAR